MLAVFRLPLHLYHRGWGRLLGHTFLVFVHAGRKTGTPHEVTAMVLRFDETTKEAVIFSAWGPNADWVRNLHVRPALRVQIGRESFVPEQRFLTEARISATLDDQHVVAVYDVGRDEESGLLFMALEFVRGETLASALARGPCRPRTPTTSSTATSSPRTS